MIILCIYSAIQCNVFCCSHAVHEFVLHEASSYVKQLCGIF